MGTEELNSQAISITYRMTETQVSLGNVAYLSLARDLSCSHVKIKELNALNMQLAILF